MRTLATVYFFIVILSGSQFHFSKNGNRHNSSLTSVYCSYKSIQADIKVPPKERAIFEFESGKRAREEGRDGSIWTQKWE